MSNVLQTVVRRGLCCGCGACAAVCPGGALAMVCGADGDLVATRTGGCVPSCGRCLDVCPFAAGTHDPRTHNERLFAASEHAANRFHENLGWHSQAVAGFSRQAEHRALGSSGGLAVWTLERLLTVAGVDRVAAVGFESERAGGKGFTFRECRTAEEVRTTAGSVYHPVSLTEILRHIRAGPPLRWAIVAIPCAVTALRQCMQHDTILAERIVWILGLSCGGCPNTFYTEFLLRYAGIRPEDATGIRFRQKVPPEAGTTSLADSSFFAATTTPDDKRGRMIPFRGLPMFLRYHGYFRLHACDFCTDLYALAADVVFKDAWATPYAYDAQGYTIALIRHPALARLFKEGRREEAVQLEELDAQTVLGTQSGQTHKRLVEVVARVAARNGTQQPSWPQRYRWWRLACAERWSRWAWRSLGRRFGVGAFWMGMAPLLVLQVGLVKARGLFTSIRPRSARRQRQSHGGRACAPGEPRP